MQDEFTKADDLFNRGIIKESGEIYKSILDNNPNSARALTALGVIAFQFGENDLAENYLRRSLQIDPEYAEAWYSLGGFCNSVGRIEEALDCYFAAVYIAPDMERANIAIFHILSFGILFDFEKAEIHFRKMLELCPQIAIYHSWLGHILYAQGRSEESVECFRRSLQLVSEDYSTHSCLIYNLCYISGISQKEIFLESCRWGERLTSSQSARSLTYNVSLVPRSKLRIGYISPDFRMHAISFFLEPLIDQHNRDHFIIYCYSAVVNPDSVTERFMMSADYWVDIKSCSDVELAERIRRDRIDVLIDLAGHTSGNRLPVFVLKPAPVQVAWLGYPNTSGLTTMDYRITDAIADPPGRGDRFYTEKLIRLPNGFLCYSPSLDAPVNSPLPYLIRGYITFVSLNNLSKIGYDLIAIWSKILLNVPKSRMVLKHKSFIKASSRERIKSLFSLHGVDSERIDTLPNTETIREHLLIYQGCDISLDSFPYNGTTTICESLWMGVPTVTLCGDRHVSRVGASILNSIGLNEYITASTAEYVETVVRLASDVQQLISLRTTLRQRMEESSICNAQQFTQNFEIAIRKAWEKWAFKARKQLTPEDLATEYFEHGVECMELGDTEEAISSFKNALKFRSNFPDACNNLGILFFNTGLPVRAIKYFNQATILDPKNNNAFCNIGNVLLNKGRNIDAINFFKKSIELEQNNPEAWYNYGIASFSLGRFDEAKIQFMEAIKISPDYHQAVNNLGNVFLATGDVVAAVDAFRHTIAICPEYLEAHSNLMLALQYQPEASEQSLFNEAQRFGDSIGNDELFHVEYCDEKDQLKQRIKIGYLSPDFKEHPAAYFLKSIIAAHDRNIFEIHCFFNNSRKDKTTDEFKNLADKWFDCRLLNDESLAEIIENEQIDILVDCAGHTAGNRLGVFALKPARFQVSWLGYPGTTGLTQMDYRITDHIADPEGDADLFHSEKLIRLQKGFLCYMPPLNSPLANCCPYETSLHVTFGSFNNLAKLNDATVLIWCRILKEVKGSRLILKNKSFVNSFVRDLWFDKFMVAGCEPEQLEIFPPTVGEKEHLDCYSEIDIALDTFPYNGTTTTCEALWMGVPVVTLKGNRHASRVGASILSHVGLNELVADSSKKYIDIAVQMAMNLDKRRDLRRNLRNMMVGTICDAKQFAFSVEAYFQKMVANKAF